MGFSLLSEVLIKAQVLQSRASCKEFLVDQRSLHPLLIPGNAETGGTKQSFLSTGNSTSAGGRAWLSLPAQSCPGQEHSLVPGCQHRSPEMPEPAAQSLDGDTRGLL